MLHFVPLIRLSLSVHFAMKISTFIVKFKLIHLQGLYFLSNCIAILFRNNSPQKPRIITTEQISGQSESSSSDVCGALRRFPHSLHLMSNGNFYNHEIHSMELSNTANKHNEMFSQRITITVTIMPFKQPQMQISSKSLLPPIQI